MSRDTGSCWTLRAGAEIETPSILAAVRTSLTVRSLLAGGVFVAGVALHVLPPSAQSRVVIVRDRATPAVAFAAREIEAAFKRRGAATTTVEPAVLAQQRAAAQIVL